MQSFTKIEIRWIAQEMSDKAGILDHIGEASDATDAERAWYRLRSEQFRSIAERLAKSAADGDKRIAIR